MSDMDGGIRGRRLFTMRFVGRPSHAFDPRLHSAIRGFQRLTDLAKEVKAT